MKCTVSKQTTNWETTHPSLIKRVGDALKLSSQNATLNCFKIERGDNLWDFSRALYAVLKKHGKPVAFETLWHNAKQFQPHPNVLQVGQQRDFSSIISNAKNGPRLIDNAPVGPAVVATPANPIMQAAPKPAAVLAPKADVNPEPTTAPGAQVSRAQAAGPKPVAPNVPAVIKSPVKENIVDERRYSPRLANPLDPKSVKVVNPKWMAHHRTAKVKNN